MSRYQYKPAQKETCQREYLEKPDEPRHPYSWNRQGWLQGPYHLVKDTSTWKCISSIEWPPDRIPDEGWPVEIIIKCTYEEKPPAAFGLDLDRNHPIGENICILGTARCCGMAPVAGYLLVHSVNWATWVKALDFCTSEAPIGNENIFVSASDAAKLLSRDIVDISLQVNIVVADVDVMFTTIHSHCYVTSCTCHLCAQVNNVVAVQHRFLRRR